MSERFNHFRFDGGLGLHGLWLPIGEADSPSARAEVEEILARGGAVALPPEPTSHSLDDFIYSKEAKTAFLISGMAFLLATIWIFASDKAPSGLIALLLATVFLGLVVAVAQCPASGAKPER